MIGEWSVFMMNNQTLIFDEKKYPITWRFNSVDCSLSDEDKYKIIFLIKDESKKLWDSLFSFNNLMEIKENYFLLAEKKDLDFDEDDKSRDFFVQKLQPTELLIFFWGRSNCAIIPSSILIKAWSDFFYPSDDDCIVYLVNKGKIIFSYEETFFYGNILTNKK